MAGEGLEEEQMLRRGGFSEEEITAWKADITQTLQRGGFSPQEIDAHFGVKEPDMAPVKEYFKQNVAKHQEEISAKQETQGEAKSAVSFSDAWDAGWQASFTGLVTKKKLPSVVMPEHAGLAMNLVSGIAGLAGDAPAMVAGAIAGSAAGGAAGSVVPVAGTVVGGAVAGGAGSFALPAALKKILMDHYEKGDIKDFNDFYERAAGTLWESMKQGAVGGLTAGAGAVVGKAVAPLANGITKTVAPVATEIATMVTAGAAVEGEIPSAENFLEAGILVGGLHGSMKVASKLRRKYVETNEHPAEIAIKAEKDPLTAQELIADDMAEAIGIKEPKAIEPQPIPKKLAEEVKAEKQKTELTEPQPALSSEQKILSMVGEQAPKPKAEMSFDKFYQDYVDVHNPIKQAVETLEAFSNKKINLTENPYISARQAVDHGSKTQHFIEKGTIDFKTKQTTGKGLLEIVKPFEKELDGFKAYLISKRAVEVEGRGIKSGFDIEAAKDVVAKGSKKYEQAAKDFVEWNNGVLDYAHKAGVISAESLSAMKEAGKSYVSFKRIFSEEEGGGKGGKAGSLKALLGSERKIQDPFMSAIENAAALIEQAEKNNAKLNFIKLSEKYKGVGLVDKVKAPQQLIKINEAEIGKLLKEMGLNDLNVEAVPESFDVFRSKRVFLKENEFEVMRDGKREVYAADPLIITSIRALEGGEPINNIFFKIAKGFTTVKKIGLTLTPEFIAKNFERDWFTASTFSKKGMLSPLDVAASVKDLMKKSDVYYEWLKSGGANGSFVDLGTKYNNVFKLNEETGFLNKSWNIIKTPIEALAVAGQLAEQATRLAEFKKVVGKNKSAASLVEGGMASREITIDFLRMGAKIQAMNAITAFQNVSIQGLDRTIRAAKDDPKSFLTRASLLITAPTVMLYFANKDEQWYKDLPRWEKDLFWNIKVGEHIYKFPRPQELGLVFGALPERALEAFFSENPNAMKDFEESIAGLITPAFIPDIASAPIEHWANKSTFTGRKIVSDRLIGAAPAYQYNDYTTESAKLMASAVRFLIPDFLKSKPGEPTLGSPLIVENYVRSYAGAQGMYALQIMDKALMAAGLNPNKFPPPSKLSDIPFIKAFVVRYPSAGAQSIEDFNSRYREAKEQENTLKLLASKLDFVNYEKEIMNPDLADKIMTLEGLNQALNTHSGLVSKIYNMPYEALESKGEEGKGKELKGEQIDLLYTNMIEMARMGNEAFAEYDKMIKAEKEKLKVISKRSGIEIEDK
jgi:hypothetical protein